MLKLDVAPFMHLHHPDEGHTLRDGPPKTLGVDRPWSAPRRVWPTLALVGWATVLAVSRTLLRARAIDIAFDDETYYLQVGLNFFGSALPGGESSPLYALWYWLESRFIRDPVVLYNANWGLLLFVTLLAFGLALRMMDVSYVGAALSMSLASVLSYFRAWPHVTLLSGALVAMAIVVGLRESSRARASSKASAVLAVAVFVRPDLLPTFGLCCAVAAFAAYREHRLAWLALPMVTLGVLWAKFGTPFGGGRLMLAFGQHYALNVVRAQGLNIDAWNSWEPFVRADFGNVSTAFGAFLANPSAFAWHVGTNAWNLPSSAYLLTPDLPSRLSVRVLLGIPMALIFAAGVVLGVAQARCDERALRLVTMSFVLMVPWSVSALLIAPEPHYFMAPLVSLGMLAAYGICHSGLVRIGVWMLALVSSLLLLVGLATWLQGRTILPNLATIRLLRTLDLPEHPVMLEADFGRGVYANLAYQRLSQTDCVPFAPCLHSRRPDIIVNDPRLRAYYMADDGFIAFVRSPTEAGFEDKLVPGTDVHIYLRRSTGTR